MRKIEICYTSVFSKHFKKLPLNLKKTALNKETIFRQNPFNPILKTHVLTGKLKGFYSFSIKYHWRILFIFEKDGSITFIDIGTHSIYG